MNSKSGWCHSGDTMSEKLPYSKKLLRTSRDAGYLKTSRVKAKEFFETHDVYEKSVPYILKRLNIDRFHTVYDFCASHGFNIPYILARNKAKYGTAIDIRPSKASKRLWSHYPRLSARMNYKQEDIYRTEYEIEDNSLILAIHPCSNLALRTCDIAIENKAPIVISPCCVGKVDPFFKLFEHVNRYDKWCLTVGQKLHTAGYELTIRQIRGSATPVGTIIIGMPN